MRASTQNTKRALLSVATAVEAHADKAFPPSLAVAYSAIGIAAGLPWIFAIGAAAVSTGILFLLIRAVFPVQQRRRRTRETGFRASRSPTKTRQAPAPDEFAIVLPLPTDHCSPRLHQLIRELRTPVPLHDGRILDVAASVGAATPRTTGTHDLTQLQRAADAALYDGKHTGLPVLADHSHTTTPSVNGRRAGRPGTTMIGAAA